MMTENEKSLWSGYAANQQFKEEFYWASATESYMGMRCSGEGQQ